MNEQRTYMRWIAGALVALGMGCATAQVTHTSADPKANFSGYRTFQVAGGKLVEHGVVNEGDLVLRERIDAALAQELTDKGLAEAMQQPDLIVTYVSRVETRPEIREVWSTPVYGWFTQPEGEGLLVANHRAHTMTVDVLDGRTKKLVWRSVVQAEDRDFRKEKYIQKAVDQALASYPAG